MPAVKTLAWQNEGCLPDKSLSDVWYWTISWPEAAPGYSELCSFLHLIFAVIPGVFVVVSWYSEHPKTNLLYMNG